VQTGVHAVVAAVDKVYLDLKVLKEKMVKQPILELPVQSDLQVLRGLKVSPVLKVLMQH
jgi:hypothetical protein